MDDLYFKIKDEMEECKDSVYDDVKSWLTTHEKLEFEKHDQIDRSISELSGKVDKLINLFEQGKGALTVVKWLGSAVVGLWAIILWAKDHIHV